MITYDHVRSRTARFGYDLTAIPTFLDRNLVAGVTVAIVNMKQKINHN